MKSFKPVILTIIFALAFIYCACNKNDSITGLNGPASNVSFSISQQQGNFGGTEFLFRPSADIKISYLISRLDAQQFADTIRYNNTNYTYSKDTTYIIGEYTGVQPGQQWKFIFSGTGQNNAQYTVTQNYTAQ